ncbi:MAG: hypothetical protein KDD89_12800, partial [Anaerolineales bacterium]|nr:hypothetical protein [Anaerolineales bacterium]
MHNLRKLEDDLRNANSYEEYAQQLATLGSMPVGFVVAIFTYLLNLNRRDIPLYAPDDLRAMAPIFLGYAVIIVLVTGGFAYYLGVRYHNRRVAAQYQQKWRLRLIPILLAVLVLTLIGVDLGITLINNAFPGLVLPTLQAVFLMGIFSATLANFIANQLFRMDLRRLLSILFLIMTAGLYYAAVFIATDNPLWWEESFSYLGTLEEPGSFLFNVTFVFAGLLVLALHPYFMYDFNILYEKGALTQRGHQLLRVALGALGILVAGIGLFIYGVTPLQTTLHNLSAYLMAGIVFGF